MPWLQNHINHSIYSSWRLLTWAPVDLQDKLSNSNLDSWFILPINGSPISWTRDRYSSDIDQALVNSSMVNIWSCLSKGWWTIFGIILSIKEKVVFRWRLFPPLTNFFFFFFAYVHCFYIIVFISLFLYVSTKISTY